MVLNPNQFSMEPQVGDVDLNMATANILTCAVSASESTNLVPGQAVKLEDSAGGLPKVLALAANTDEVFGFVSRNMKDVNRSAGETVEIARDGTVVYMTAGAAIARGAYLQVVYNTNKVITNAGANPVVGQALDKAAADGDLIRVQIVNRVPMALNQLSDVAITSPTNGQVLKYVSANTDWENGTDNT